MPPRDWRLRVHDMLEAIGDIQSATTGLTYEAFVANRVTAHAVLYNFTIIGEALSALPAELRARHPEVPWRDIRNLRNVVTHVYFGVRMVTIWETIQNA